MDSIYAYTDYRQFLSDFYREKKAANRHFSHRHVAAKVGIKSTGHFSLILQGKANISPELSLRLGEFMKLRKREAEYFESMVAYGQAKSDAARRKAWERLVSHKECRVDIVEPDRFEYYEKWYYSAVLRMLDIYPFSGDHAKLARMLDPPITPAEAKKAISLLARLDFIRPRPDGRFETTARTLSTGYAARSPHITAFLKQSADLALRAIEAFPRPERNISSVHFSVSEETFRKIEQEARDFRRKVMAMAEADTAPTRAYQFSTQIFPLSGRSPRTRPG
ncbi:MAG: TIGR02147 family protein [Fibrobacteres bacterium]|jgi:uncharacterized protein (TIGR02147 family)|nr:TIGR02147 family protein [Fibrobacterota bacterium]